MTEADWLASTDAAAMIATLPQPVSARKLRLFACGCCRAVWPQLTDPRSRAAVLVAERFADGEATEGELRAAWRPAWDAATLLGGRHGLDSPAYIAAWYAAATLASDAATAARQASPVLPPAAQADLLRCLWGNPFRPVDTAPMYRPPLWHASDDARLTVFALAKAAYDERLPSGLLDPARLAVLADALEDAGCGEAALLSHLRETERVCGRCGGTGFLFGQYDEPQGRSKRCPDCGGIGRVPAVRVRGDWAVDLILGKA